jgi:hypothetical protein
MLLDLLGAYLAVGIGFTVLFLLFTFITLLMRASGDDKRANNRALRHCLFLLVFGWTWPLLAVWFVIIKPIMYTFKSFKEAFTE